MKRKYAIILTIIIVLIIGLFVFRLYNKWHYEKFQTNIDSNHDIMKSFVEDDEEYILIAFKRLESEFKNPNDFNLDAFSVSKRDTTFNGRQDTVYSVYFTYYLTSDNHDMYFSKVSVFNKTPTIQLYSIDTRKNEEYIEVKNEKDKTEKETMESIKESFRQMPDSTRKAILETIKKVLDE